jgi:transcriptional regulator with XRE-family HTH domain
VPTRPDHGSQIAAARAALRLSLKETAKVAGLQRNSIVNAERRGRIPRFSYASTKIADALEPMGVTFETRQDTFVVVIRPEV